MAIMALQELTIQAEDIHSLRGHVIVQTGGSSGIGLAFVNQVLQVGAFVVLGDVNPPPLEHPQLTFVRTDVTDWTSLKELFKHATKVHSRVDHVFANAGIANMVDYLDVKVDESGEVLEPVSKTMDINLKGVLNTCHLGMHYMRSQDPPGGSVVVTASASSFQQFRGGDYTVAKHGVLGLMRSVVPRLVDEKIPIRFNALAPSWTSSGLVDPAVVAECVGSTPQAPEIPALSAAYLMADVTRQGQMIYSELGKYWEIEHQLLLLSLDPIPGFPHDEPMGRLAALGRRQEG